MVRCEECQAKENGICPIHWGLDEEDFQRLFSDGDPLPQIETDGEAEEPFIIGCGAGIIKVTS